jgi:hypothetical protein
LFAINFALAIPLWDFLSVLLRFTCNINIVNNDYFRAIINLYTLLCIHCFFLSVLKLRTFFRTLIAALRYNENCQRPVIVEEEHREKLRVEYLKYMGGKGKAVKVREDGTHGRYSVNWNLQLSLVI